jgi:tetratricopeptide (TPR) repeat protein
MSGPAIRFGASALLCVGLSAAAPRWQPPPSFTTYRDLVARYRAFDDGAIGELAAMSRATVTAGVEEAARTATDVWGLEERQAAAILHTDAAAGLLALSHTDAAVFHITAAGRLIDATLSVSPATAAYGARWYTLAADILQRHGVVVWANELRKRARDRFSPSPAELALEQALSRELDATNYGTGSSHYVGHIGGLEAGAARRFRAAADGYDRALRLDPDMQNGWLHLGRSRMLLAELDAARAAFGKAMDGPDPRHRYLATMFLGSIAERQEHFSDAEKHYRDAMALYRHAQSAPLAIAHLLSRMGRDTEARTILAVHAAASTRPVDPLWTYLIGPQRPLAFLLNELRAEVSR